MSNLFLRQKNSWSVSSVDRAARDRLSRVHASKESGRIRGCLCSHVSSFAPRSLISLSVQNSPISYVALGPFSVRVRPTSFCTSLDRLRPLALSLPRTTFLKSKESHPRLSVNYILKSPYFEVSNKAIWGVLWRPVLEEHPPDVDSLSRVTNKS